MISVSATEFSKQFGRYRDLVQREPIAVTSHGRVSGYFIAAAEYEHYLQSKTPEYDLRIPENPFRALANQAPEASEEHEMEEGFDNSGFFGKIKTQMK